MTIAGDRLTPHAQCTNTRFFSDLHLSKNSCAGFMWLSISNNCVQVSFKGMRRYENERLVSKKLGIESVAFMMCLHGVSM